MYTLQNFQDAVIDTKNKLERLLSYFNSLDKHTKKTIPIRSDHCLCPIRSYQAQLSHHSRQDTHFRIICTLQ